MLKYIHLCTQVSVLRADSLYLQISSETHLSDQSYTVQQLAYDRSHSMKIMCFITHTHS